jgi:uncharacterized delta-60 repeat protein
MTRRNLFGMLGAALLAAAGTALAAAGALDRRFGTQGVFVDPSLAAALPSAGKAVAVQPDGKILVAGYQASEGGNMTVWRLTPNGSPDSTFDADGVAQIHLPGIERAAALALQNDGKIVVAGGDSTSFPEQFIVARLNADGSPDPTFAAVGHARWSFVGSQPAVAATVVIQPDGKIVAAGYTGSPGGNEFALVRFHPDGEVDTSFGVEGQVTTAFGPGTGAGIEALALQPDGKIVAGGQRSAGGGYDVALARYLADGSLDLAFGAEGKVVTDFGEDSLARALCLQPDGRIVAAGVALQGNRGNFALARYLTSGGLDLSFSADGRVVTDLAPDAGEGAFALLIQPDGKIVAAGETDDGLDLDFAVARYRRDGRLDRRFGNAGRRITDLSPRDSIGSIALQANGRIVAAGISGSSPAWRMTVLRYLGR